MTRRGKRQLGRKNVEKDAAALTVLFNQFVSGTGLDHGSLSGLTDDDHPGYLLDDASTAGSGLTISSRTLNVVGGDGLSSIADSLDIDLDPDSGLEFSAGGELRLGTPGTISATSSAVVSGASHNHDITAASDAGGASVLLKSDANGAIQLDRLGVGTAPGSPDAIRVRTTGTHLALQYDASNEVNFSVNSSGNITISPTGTLLYFHQTSGAAAVAVSGQAANSRLFYLMTNYSPRWSIFANPTAESGSDAGSNFVIRAYNDSGAFLTDPILINRATGHIGINDLSPRSDATVTIESANSAVVPLRVQYDGSNYGTFQSSSGGILTVGSSGNIALDPTGADVHPLDNYAVNLGTLTKKWLTLHVAEIWSSSIVAENTAATIRGRILVTSTTLLAQDLEGSSAENIILNPGFEGGDHTPTTNFDNWQEVEVSGQIVPDVTTPHAGAASLKIQQGVSDDTYELSDAFTVIEGAYYDLTFYTKTDAGDNAGRYAVWDSSNSAFITSWTTTGITGTTWTQVSASFLVPAGCTQVKIGFRPSTTLTDWAYFDTVTVTLDPDYIYIEDDILASGDTVILDTNNQIEFMLTTSASTSIDGGSYYRLAVTRDRDGTGLNAWPIGSAVVNTGAAGDGFLDIYSVTSVPGVGGVAYGPTILGNVRNSDTYNDWSEVFGIGNLKGLYGIAADTYGIGLGKYSATTAWMTIDPGNGIRMYRNSVRKIEIESDGDIFIGEDVSAAGTTFLAIFSNAQTYNSESMSAGDVLIGDNSASKANIFWDKSAGRLNFRGGSTTELYISTDGYLVAGGDDVRIHGDGIDLEAQAGYVPAGSAEITWYDGPGFLERAGGIDFESDKGVGASNYVRLKIYTTVYSGTTEDPSIVLDSNGSTGSWVTMKAAYIRLDPISDVQILGDLNSVTGDAYFESGIAVGAGITPPVPNSGEIIFGDTLISYKNSTQYTVYSIYFKSAESTYTTDTEFTTTQTTGVKTSDFSDEVAAGAVAALVRLDVWGNQAGQWVSLGVASDSYQVTGFAPDASDTKTSNVGIVKLTSDQEIYISRSVGTSNSVHYALYVIGYLI